MLRVIVRCLVISILIAVPVAAAFATGIVEFQALSSAGTAQSALLAGVAILVSAFLASLLASLWNGAPDETAAGGPDAGVVKWFNVSKGFGFITLDDGGDVFVHFRDIRGKGHRSLVAGQRVAFQVKQTDKGPQAHEVTVTGSS